MTQLAYEIKGTGDPVLLLHAFPLSGAMWRVQTDKLSRSRRVIVPDLPGFGKSARQKTPSIAEMARAVAALLDELSINEPVFTAGLSMGGYVAFEFYRQFPKRVNALGLISTRAKPDTEDQKIKRREMADKVRAGGLAGLAAEMPAKLLGATTLKKQKDVAEAVKKMILAGNPEGTADALTAMAGRADSSELFKSMRIPVLIVAGALRRGIFSISKRRHG